VSRDTQRSADALTARVSEGHRRKGDKPPKVGKPPRQEVGTQKLLLEAGAGQAAVDLHHEIWSYFAEKLLLILRHRVVECQSIGVRRKLSGRDRQ
jgi:hypothetical protein